MRKNDLIKMLQDIEGNPEIVIWNGYVDDYMNIEKQTFKITLVKETEDFIFNGLKGEWCQMNKSWDVPEEVLQRLRERAKKIHKNRQYDFENPYVTEEEYERWYGKKKLTKYVITPKLRGKTSLGIFTADDINY